MNINDFKYPGGYTIEEFAENLTRIVNYFQEQVESAKMDAHPTYNDPIEVDLHLTRAQAQALRDVLAHVGGFGRRELIELITDQLEDHGYGFDGHNAGDIDGEVEFL